MAIQVNITQPSGVVTAYHVIANVNLNPNNPVTVEGSHGNFTIQSYLSSAAYQAGDAPVNIMTLDVSGMLGAAVNFTVFITQMVTGLEQYVISSIAAFSGGTIVS